MKASYEMAMKIIALLLSQFEFNYRVEFIERDEIAACEMRYYRNALKNIATNLLGGESVEWAEQRISERISRVTQSLSKEKDEMMRAAYMGENRANYTFLSIIH